MRRHVPFCALLALAACKSLDVPVVVIPDTALVYRIEPSILVYTFVDTSQNFDLHLSWINNPPPPVVPLAGWNCIALMPRTATDTIGSFLFAFVGPNTGRLLRTQLGVTDTTNGFFLRGDEGTGGTFAVTSTGQLKLVWSDGIRSRFFDPSAAIRLANDTIFSDVILTDKADSVHVEWQVRWVRAFDCKV